MRPGRAAAAPVAQAAARRRATRVLVRHRARLLARRGVSGVGVGRRLRAGAFEAEICLRVYVRRKRPPADLPTRARLPAAIEGVPVDVIEADFRAAGCREVAAARRRRRDPLQGGLELAADGGEAGTLGLLLRGADGETYGLTCEHVAALGQDVVQPSGAVRPVGVVTHAERSGRADLDAALARLDPDARGHAAGLFAGAASVRVTARRPREGEAALVVGACSGKVSGEVLDESAPARVAYADGTILYRDQVLVRVLPDRVREGDSGALVLAEDGRTAWGLLIAVGGADEHELGVVTPLTRVLAHARLQPGGAAAVPLTAPAPVRSPRRAARAP